MPPKSKWMVACGPRDIKPGETAVVTSDAPLILFRADEVLNLLDSDDLYIYNITVGSGAEQLSKLGLASPCSIGQLVDRLREGKTYFDTCQPTQRITLVIENKSETARRRFALVLRGWGVM